MVLNLSKQSMYQSRTCAGGGAKEIGSRVQTETSRRERSGNKGNVCAPLVGRYFQWQSGINKTTKTRPLLQDKPMRSCLSFTYNFSWAYFKIEDGFLFCSLFIGFSLRYWYVAHHFGFLLSIMWLVDICAIVWWWFNTILLVCQVIDTCTVYSHRHSYICLHVNHDVNHGCFLVKNVILRLVPTSYVNCATRFKCIENVFIRCISNK